MNDYIRSVQLREMPSNAYWANLPAIASMAEIPLRFTAPVTFLVGENGMGKSTLIEAIAVAWGLNPEGGSRNFNFSTNDSHSDLHRYLVLGKGGFPRDSYFLRAESLYNVASNIDQLDQQPAAAPPVIQGYGGVSLHQQSHGESFLALVQNRFRGNGLYILDEPEAALSPMRLMTLLCEIHRLVNAGSQLIIATHSPILMAYPGGKIWQLTQDGMKKTTLKETEHFQVTKRFLDQPEQMIHYLLK